MRTLEQRVTTEVRVSAAKARQAACREGRNDFGAKCFVACLTIADVCLFTSSMKTQRFQHVSVLMYHSKMKKEDRQKKDELTVMVATDAFSTGTDAPDVHSVIIAGGARSLVEMWQACGHGGRDGKQAFVNILYHRGHLTRASAGNITGYTEGAGDFQKWADNRSRCRRVGIEETMQGLKEYPTCRERGMGTEHCDICRPAGVGFERLGVGGRGVSVSGSKRPSDSELKRSRKKQVVAHRECEAQANRMRHWGQQLSMYCVACLFAACTSSFYKSCPGEYAASMRRNVERCNLSSCRNIRFVCARCLQSGHRARECMVLPSVEMTGKMRCRRCFIEGVERRNIHWSSEFGRASACPYEACTKLLMLCYGNPGTWSSLLQIVPEERKKSIQNATEFADWLVNDNVEDHVGIFEAMEWAHKYLNLKYFDI